MADVQSDAGVPPAYPFEEFLRHVEEVHAMLEREKKTRQPPVEEDGSLPFEFTIIRVNEYMKPLYPDWKERQYKMQRFCLIMHYISTHMNEFDTGDFAVQGSPKVGGLIGGHLLRAVHQLFTASDLRDMKEPTPEEVMKLAEAFRE